MKKILIPALFVGLLFSSCGDEASTEQEPQKVIENCIYTYNPTLTKLDWTAYKFIRKAGVGGTFMNIDVDGDLKGGDPKTIIESLSFTIPVSSIETNDPSRNGKINEFFFGNLTNTGNITGRVVQLGEDGKAVLAITMNELTQNVEGAYTLVDNKFTYSTEIDVNEWNAAVGLAALNKECEGLHTDIENGDTESKLWPDVTISFSTELTKSCD